MLASRGSTVGASRRRREPLIHLLPHCRSSFAAPGTGNLQATHKRASATETKKSYQMRDPCDGGAALLVTCKRLEAWSAAHCTTLRILQLSTRSMQSAQSLAVSSTRSNAGWRNLESFAANKQIIYAARLDRPSPGLLSCTLLAPFSLPVAADRRFL